MGMIAIFLHSLMDYSHFDSKQKFQKNTVGSSSYGWSPLRLKNQNPVEQHHFQMVHWKPVWNKILYPTAPIFLLEGAQENVT